MRRNEEGYSLPLHAPVYGPRRATDHEAIFHRAIWIRFEGNAEFSKWLVPEPFEYVSNRMVIMLAERRQPPALGSGFLSTIFIPVKHNGTLGSYVPIGFASNDELIIGYRELYAFGVVGCDETTLEYNGNTISCNLKRYQEPIVRASVFLEKRSTEDFLGDVLGHGTFQIQKIPSLDEGKDIRRIISPHYRRGPNTEVREQWVGRASLEFPSNVWQLQKLNPVNVLDGFYREMTINYKGVEGKVLAEES